MSTGVSCPPFLLDSGAIRASLCLRQNDAGLFIAMQCGGQVQGEADLEAGMETMADKELEITTNTYIFAGVGAIVLGALAALSLGGTANTIAAAVVGGLAGGCLGLFF